MRRTTVMVLLAAGLAGTAGFVGSSMSVSGLVAATGAGRLLEGLLYQTSARDPVVYGAVAIALAAVAGFACYLPARRASRLDPIVTLRQE